MNQASASHGLGSPQTWAALYGRYGERLAGFVALLLVILTARAAAELVWALVPVPAAAWKPLPPAPSANATQGSLNINAIASGGLFGRYQPQIKAIDTKTAPETQLNLKLLGVFAGSKAYSRALIATSDGQEKPYAVGDPISGATVESIFPDRVVLLRNGRPELLRLPKEASGGNDVAASEPAGPDDGGDEGSDDDIAALADQLNAARLADIREQLLSNPGKAQQFIRLQPMMAGGGLHGYRVFPGPNRALFNGTGLRPGDVVTSVNGVNLDDPARALQMLADLAHANNLTVTVNRGGTSQTLSLSLNP
jgi:general secretion pathway protein C